MIVNRQPFLTGSRVYGKPTKDSDYDVVWLYEEGEDPLFDALYTGLINLDDPNDQKISVSRSLRVGKLNIIIVNSEQEYDAWKSATEHMKSRKTSKVFFTKEEAKSIIDAEYEEQGLEPRR
jgi:predicted nucleotidyltransferase